MPESPKPMEEMQAMQEMEKQNTGNYEQEQEDLSEMFPEGMTAENLQKQHNGENKIKKLFSDSGETEEFGNLGKKMPRKDEGALFADESNGAEKQKINPSIAKKAWENLSGIEKKFILTAKDETFKKIIAKSPNRQKALNMISLRKLIKNKHPLASKIGYEKAA